MIPLPADKPFDVVCLGYNSVDFLARVPRMPRPGDKVCAVEFSQQGGGQCATAAVALRRFGFRARYIGKFGGTPTGAFARESVAAEGVDVSACATAAPGVENQIATIWIEEKTGERTIVYKRPEGLELLPEELDREAVCSGRVLLIDAHQLPAITPAAGWARQEGIPVVVDAERTPEGIEDLLERCDYILCDQKFPRDFTGEADPEKALRALSAYGRLVATTRGGGGSLALAGGRLISTSGYLVETVDTTGAGDVFHAGFVAGLLLGLDEESTLRLANASAALSCRRLGGRAGIPTLDEALALAGIDPASVRR